MCFFLASDVGGLGAGTHTSNKALSLQKSGTQTLTNKIASKHNAECRRTAFFPQVSLTPPGPRPTAPVFSFPHLKPCPSCVPRLRMQPQGLYDFPPVDLPIHLAANCHHAVATAVATVQQQQQQQTNQKGSSRGRSAQGSRLFSRRMMTEVSGATPVKRIS